MKHGSRHLSSLFLLITTTTFIGRNRCHLGVLYPVLIILEWFHHQQHFKAMGWIQDRKQQPVKIWCNHQQRRPHDECKHAPWGSEINHRKPQSSCERSHCFSTENWDIFPHVNTVCVFEGTFYWPLEELQPKGKYGDFPFQIPNRNVCIIYHLI